MKRDHGRFGIKNSGRTLKKSGVVGVKTNKDGFNDIDKGKAYGKASQRIREEFSEQFKPIDVAEEVKLQKESKKGQRKRALKQAAAADSDQDMSSGSEGEIGMAKHVPMSTVDQVMQRMTAQELKEFKREHKLNMQDGNTYVEPCKNHGCPCCIGWGEKNASFKKRNDREKQIREGIKISNLTRGRQ